MVRINVEGQGCQAFNSKGKINQNDRLISSLKIKGIDAESHS